MQASNSAFIACVRSSSHPGASTGPLLSWSISVLTCSRRRAAAQAGKWVAGPRGGPHLVADATGRALGGHREEAVDGLRVLLQLVEGAQRRLERVN